MLRGRLILQGAVMLLITAMCAPAGAWTVECVHVTHGDTIRVKKEGREIDCLMYGVHTPGRGKKPWGKAAREYTSRAILGKTIRIDPITKDSRGRVVGLVYTPAGEMLNEELIENGLAEFHRRFCTSNVLCVKLNYLERQARNIGSGMWEEEKEGEPKKQKKYGNAR